MAEFLKTNRIEFKQDLAPSREFVSDNRYWFSFSKEQTGVRLICVQDLDTGVILSTQLGDDGKRLASFKGWSGGRHSRAPGYPWEIMAGLVRGKVDTDKKMGDMSVKTGHASLGDIARTQVDFSNVPMHLAYSLFNTSATNAGQEKSTRYQQAFGGSLIHPLRNYMPETVGRGDLMEVDGQYLELAKLALVNYAGSRDYLRGVFTSFFKPKTEDEQKSLESRVLDCSRSYLLFGQNCGLTFEDSFRDVSRIISELKASPLTFYQKTAFLMEAFLAPDEEVENEMGFLAEAPSLIRHTEARGVTNANLAKLQSYLEGETNLLSRVEVNTLFRGLVPQSVEFLGAGNLSEMEKAVMQRILCLWPGMDHQSLGAWVKNADLAVKHAISAVVLAGHNNYQELPMIDATRGMTLVYEANLGEIRDFDRNKAWGRFLALPLVYGTSIDVHKAYQIICSGFGIPAYFDGVNGFSAARREFVAGLEKYYSKLQTFMGTMERKFGDSIDYSFVVNLLPLAHHFRFLMHGDPKQAVYLPSQRIRPGGHINYRILAYEASRLIAASDPYLSALNVGPRPDPENRAEFFGRS